MKARLISVLLVIALLVTVGVITAQAAYSESLEPKNDVFEAAKKMDFSDPNNLPKNCPYCGTDNVTWTKMSTITAGNSGRGKTFSAGHYYLDEDRLGMDYYLVPYGASQCIHLNGKTISSSTIVFDVRKGKTLNVMGEGTISGGYSSSGAGNADTGGTGFYATTMVIREGTVNLCGGTWTNATTGDKGSVISLQEMSAAATTAGTLRIFNGTGITVKEDSKYTRGLLVRNGLVDMYGGTISGGNVTSNTGFNQWGGNVLLFTNGAKNGAKDYTATLMAYGGTISGGKAAYGGNIAIAGLAGAGQLTARLGENGSLNAPTITGGEASKSGDEVGGGGNIYVICDTNPVTFRSDKGTFSKGKTDGVGGNILVRHAEPTNVVDEATGEVTGTVEAAKLNCMLRGTITITEGEAVSGGGNIALENVRSISSGIIHFGLSDDDYRDMEFEVSDGKAKSAGQGGNILITGALSKINVSGKMTVSGGKAMQGGNIAVVGATTTIHEDVALSGGTWYGTATGNDFGGAMYVADATVTFKGSIDGGRARNGGNLVLAGDATVTLDGATITGGTARYSGGSIYMNSENATLNIKGGTQISGGSVTENKSYTKGGNMYLVKGTVNLMDGTITDGEAYIEWQEQKKENGEPVVDENGEPVMESKNYGLGGNICIDGGKFEMTGGEISDGAAQTGGNIYIDGGCEFNLKAGSISGGSTQHGNGGSIFLNNKNIEFNMSGGTISGGVCPENLSGANLYVRAGTATLTGGAVTSTLGRDDEGQIGNAVYVGVTSDTPGYGKLVLGGSIVINNEHSSDNVWINGKGMMVVREDFAGTVKVNGHYVSNKSAGQELDPTYFVGEGPFTGSLTIPRNNDINLFQFTRTEEVQVEGAEPTTKTIKGLKLANAKNNEEKWVNVTEDFADYTLYGGKVTLAKDETLNLANGATVTAELAGHTATVNVAGGEGEATFKGTNNTTETHGTANLGTGVKASNSAVWNDAGYYNIASVNGTEATYHKLEIKISAIALRTKAKGLYYRSQVNTDDTLRSQITDVGIFLGVPTGVETTETMATAMKKITNFFGNDGEKTYDSETSGFYNATITIGPDFDWTKITSVLVENIFKTSFKDVDEDQVPAVNRLRGEAPIVGVPYVVLGGDKVLTAQSHVEKSMKDYMEMVDQVLNDTTKITNAQKQDLLDFYDAWMQSGFDGWTLPNLRQAYAESQAPADPVE